jgi:hypothetical protein
MIDILKEVEKVQKKQESKPNKLTMEDKLLMTSEYLREYRAYFHITKSRNINESTAITTMKWIEDLMQIRKIK